MPKRLFEQAPVTLNGLDVSCDIENLTLMQGKRPAVDVTGLCNEFDQFLSPNIKKWGVQMNFFNNWDATSTGSSIVAGISVALQSVWNSSASSGVPFVLRATTGVRSATNPEWSGYVGMDGDFTAIGGGLAEADKGSVTLKGMSDLSFFTSAT